MIESLNLVKYTAIGFAICYLSLEVVWHMTACGISYESKAISVKAFKIGSIGQGMIL